MDLIEQYVQAVISYLPGSLKKKARKVVKSKIEGGLPDDYTEMDIHNQLQKLGSAQEFAREFRTKQYLIGPNYYPQYLTFLQKILPVAYVIFLFAQLLDFFWGASDRFWVEQLLLQPLNSSIQFVILVTLVFIILEKKNFPLPESILIIPKPKSEEESPIQKKYTLIINAFLTLAGLFLIQFCNHVIAIYPPEAAPIPLFQADRLNAYLPYVFTLGATQLILIFLQVLLSEWNRSLAWLNALYNAAIFIFLLFFVTDRALFNPDFTAYFANWWALGIPFLVLSFGLCLINSLKGFKNKTP